MNIVKKIVFFLILFCGCHTMFSQKENTPIVASSPAKMKSMGKQALKNRDAYLALHYYEAYNALRSDDVEVIKNLADLYKMTRDYSSAVLAYDKLYLTDTIKHLNALYEKGIMQKMLGDYTGAKTSLLKFKADAGKRMAKDLKKQLRVDLLGCDSGMVYLEFPEDRIKVKNAGSVINNPHVEFGPVPLDTNKILFGSLTSDTIHYYDVSYDGQETQPLREFYVAEKQNDVWKKTLLDKINDQDFQMGKVVYSKPTKTYYFTKCKRNVQGRTVCNLYSGKEQKNKDLEVRKLDYPINMPGFTTTQPSVHYDTLKKVDYLYFVSDRPKGKGGLDIYYSYYNKRKKTWNKARNLGGRVNTAGTDGTPYYDDKSSTLYFSSDGFPSMGGLDVFKSIKDEKNRRMIPINLGSPINTSQDDLDFSIYKDGKTAYVVSNRPGGTPYMHETCCDDIFEIKILPESFAATINVWVTNEKNDAVRDNQLLVVKEDLRNRQVTVDTLRFLEGEMDLELQKNKGYQLSIINTGYTSDTLSFDTKNGAFKGAHIKHFKLTPVEIPDTTQILDSLIAVVVPKEIDSTPEKAEDTTSVKETNPEPGIIVDRQEKPTQTIAEPVEIREEVLEEKALEPEDIVLETEEAVGPEPIVIKEPIKEKVAEEIVIAQQPSQLDLYYEFDKFVLTTSDKQELDRKLIAYMIQNPQSKVVIRSHTDSRGSEVYNQYLSDQRMKQVVSYLESKGVANERVTAIGYGETKLKVKDTNEAGQYISSRCKENRRTEIEIVQ